MHHETGFRHMTQRIGTFGTNGRDRIPAFMFNGSRSVTLLLGFESPLMESVIPTLFLQVACLSLLLVDSNIIVGY